MWISRQNSDTVWDFSLGLDASVRDVTEIAEGGRRTSCASALQKPSLRRHIYGGDQLTMPDSHFGLRLLLQRSEWINEQLDGALKKWHGRVHPSEQPKVTPHSIST